MNAVDAAYAPPNTTLVANCEHLGAKEPDVSSVAGGDQNESEYCTSSSCGWKCSKINANFTLNVLDV